MLELQGPVSMKHYTLGHFFRLTIPFLFSIRNAMPDFGSEVMAEAIAQRALVKPVYTIPIIPLSSSNQYRHQDHLDMKDYKKVSVFHLQRAGFLLLLMSGTEWKVISIHSGS